MVTGTYQEYHQHHYMNTQSKTPDTIYLAFNIKIDMFWKDIRKHIL